VTADTTTPPRYDPEVLERAVIEEALYLHPQHLTREEFVRKMTVGPVDPGRGNDVTDAVGELERSGLLRDHAGTVVPTHAAVRFAELFELP
jgi:hypothetical protein